MRRTLLFSLALLALAAIALLYRAQYINAQVMLQLTQQDIKRQNDQAAALLAQRTAERNAKQAELERLAREQERADADARDEIARLTDELRARPVRVRLVTQTGYCGGSADRDPTAAAEPGGGDAAPAYGLLPADNSRRLAEAIAEVETLSAAYRSCRAALLIKPD